jgi:hypothetical protein
MPEFHARQEPNMKPHPALILCIATFAALASGARADDAKIPAKLAGTKIPLVFAGGHDTDPRDHGRPVVLIAAALKVPADLFRETFTHVKPAPAGRDPQPEQVRQNKQALLRGLEPHGVTNDRLDEVSNYYRYNARRDELWRNKPAAGYATVSDGVITSVTITDAGAGYTSEPTVTVRGMGGVKLKATLAFDTAFDKNGSVKDVAVVPASSKGAGTAPREDHD